jgi:hypothetical protein
MFRRMFSMGAALAFGAMVLAGLSAAAGEKKNDKGKAVPAGVWAQQGGEAKIEFGDKNVMKIFPHGDNDAIIVVCSYTVEKKTLIKARIAELDGKAKEKAKDVLPIGLEFRFTWQVDGDVATVGNVKGENVERLKSHLEGKYDKK